LQPQIHKNRISLLLTKLLWSYPADVDEMLH